MFRNQNSFGDAPQKDAVQKEALPVEEIPIHTMAKDLKSPVVSASELSAFQERTTAIISNRNMTEKQQSSPFLNPVEAPATPQKQFSDSNSTTPTLKRGAPVISIQEDPKKGIVFTILILLLIIVVAGAGTYYFILTRKTEAPASSEELIETSEIIKDEDLESGIKEDFSETMPNYLVIDATTLDQTSFKEILREKSEAIISAGATAPIEFILVDQENAPISFADFAKISGIGFSESIMGSLDKNFSLFIINDASNPGIALAIKTLATSNLKNNLLNEEQLLSTQLGPILLSEFEPSTVPFNNHSYKGQSIRYQNLISPQKLSVDYAITETMLVFATTKLTIESVLDTLSSNVAPATGNAIQ